jgi:hypothetical protein
MPVLFVFLAAGATMAAERHSEHLVGGELAGQDLGPDQWVIEVTSQQPIQGTVRIETVNPEDDPAANVPFGYTWTWGDRKTDIVPVFSDLPAGTTEHVIPIELTAPNEAGAFYLIFGHGTAVNLQQVFSATYWEDGTPIWDDDNDLLDLGEEQLEEARRYGYVEDWTFLREGEYGPEEIAVVPVKIVVTHPTM